MEQNSQNQCNQKKLRQQFAWVYQVFTTVILITGVYILFSIGFYSFFKYIFTFIGQVLSFIVVTDSIDIYISLYFQLIQYYYQLWYFMKPPLVYLFLYLHLFIYFCMGCGNLSMVPIIPEKYSASSLRQARFKKHEIKVYENVKKITYILNQTQQLSIHNVLKQHFLLFKLQKIERNQLIECMDYYLTSQNEYVYKEGSPASLFFIIIKGQIVFQVDKKQVKKLKQGDCFGELAIIYSDLRSGSIKTLEECIFICLHFNIFRRLLMRLRQHNSLIIRSYLNNIHYFNYLSKKQKKQLASHIHEFRYYPNTTIYRKKEYSTSFFIILTGTVQIQTQENTYTLSAGQYFGQQALFCLEARKQTAKTHGLAYCLSIGRQALKQCLCQGSAENLYFYTILRQTFSSSKIFNHLPKLTLDKIIETGQIKFYRDQDIILGQKILVEFMVVCVQGSINNTQKGYLYYDNAMLKQQYTHQKLIKMKNGYVYFFYIETINNILDKPLIRLLEKMPKQKRRLLQKRGNRYEETHEVKLVLKNFRILKRIALGQVSKIYLVEDIHTEQLYALKYIPWREIQKRNLQNRLKGQLKIYPKLANPFILKIFSTYQDQQYIYQLMEYYQCGDLYDLLQEIKIMKTAQTKFYIGVALLCLQYLHYHHIIYRDIKPQNFVLDCNGYSYMIDFRSSKILEQHLMFQTYTILGTPHYMAPQIIKGDGYGLSSDFWSLGIMLYQMLFGKFPYGNKLDDPYLIYKSILQHQLIISKQDFGCEQFLRTLLDKNIQERKKLSVQSLKKMEYFKYFNWFGLQKRQMIAPYLPKEKIQNSTIPNMMEYLKRQKYYYEKDIEIEGNQSN